MAQQPHPVPPVIEGISPSGSSSSLSSVGREYEHLRPKTTDRGWNDPPTQLFAGSPQTVAGGNKKALANKRKNMRPSAAEQAALYNSSNPPSGAGTPQFGSPSPQHTHLTTPMQYTGTGASVPGTPISMHGANPYPSQPMNFNGTPPAGAPGAPIPTPGQAPMGPPGQYGAPQYQAPPPGQNYTQPPGQQYQAPPGQNFQAPPGQNYGGAGYAYAAPPSQQPYAQIPPAHQQAPGMPNYAGSMGGVGGAGSQEMHPQAAAYSAAYGQNAGVPTSSFGQPPQQPPQHYQY
eukprot:comp17583_c0_seq1/m.17214 comp17583_c0_seq1/g.17214  ORF comp17583_c0_seq1/g.17214 comp17583_c0_seq1/m.17214 type:complete len:289 (-) comp17583_c0_seq1:808-1674(-)